jgi:hypothetical protein
MYEIIQFRLDIAEGRKRWTKTVYRCENGKLGWQKEYKWEDGCRDIERPSDPGADVSCPYCDTGRGHPPEVYSTPASRRKIEYNALYNEWAAMGGFPDREPTYFWLGVPKDELDQLGE